MKNNALFHLFWAFLVFADVIESNSPILSSKIVGGLDTNLAFKKFMASLRMREKHFCCGFLISKRIVLSSGFCVFYMRSQGRLGFIDASVFVGDVDFSHIKSGIVVDVRQANYHENYDPEDPIITGDYDIGYILLETQLPQNNNLGVAHFLPRFYNQKSNASIYGWGSHKIENPEIALCDVPMSQKLKQIPISIINRRFCENILLRPLTTNQRCGHGVNNGTTVSQGDAGSPVMKGSFVNGITSIVNMKGPHSPFVLVRIDMFEQYIDDLKETFPDDRKNRLSVRNKTISESADITLRKRVRIERGDKLRELFAYKSDPEGLKYAVCITCLKSTGFEEIIKMKDGNTSGLKYHLKKHHSEIFEKIYGASNSSGIQIPKEECVEEM